MKKYTSSRNMQLLGQHLRSLRNDMRLSIHEVARRTGLSPSFISKIETNTFQSITVQALLALADTYRVPLQVILEYAGFLEENADGLPDLAFYLKAKYRAPHQATQDMELAWEIVKKKYLIS